MLAFIFSVAITLLGPEGGQYDVMDSTKDKSIQARDTVKNKYVTIDNIFIIGNRRTKEPIILRELSVKKGQLLYYPDLLDHLKKDENKIFNTRLFNKVEVTTIDLSPDQVDIVIRVDERWYTFPIPVFKLIDRNFNDWWTNRNRDLSRINYGLKFYQFNVRGRNEKLKLLAQFGFTRMYGLTYTLPYLDRSQQHGLQVNVDYGEDKNLAIGTFDHKQEFYSSDQILKRKIGAQVKYTHRGKFYNYHDVSLGFERIQIHDSIAILNPQYMLNNDTEQKMFLLGYQFTQDKRDITAYPLKGYRVTAGIEKRGLGIYNDLDIFTFNASYSRYEDIGKGFYASNYTYGYYSSPKNQSYNQYRGLGYGNKFVKGYELYLIEGSSYFLNKTTFKKRIISGSFELKRLPLRQFKTFPFSVYIKTYFDTGYVNNFDNYEQSSELAGEWIYGTGVGLDFVTFYDFVIRLEYSINKQNETGLFFHFKKGF